MPAGRPRKYQTPEEMQVVIDQYFKECEGEILLDKDGNPMLDKWGHPIIINKKPPTIIGLALALGFTSGRYQQCLLEDHESTRHLKKCR